MKGCVLYKIGTVCGGIALAAFLPTLSYAQTASQITPETYAPRLERNVRGSISLPQAAGLASPEGGEALKITLSAVRVNGGYSELQAQTQAITSSLANREISVDDLFAAARKIQGLYAQAGYILARVTVPEQDLHPGGTAYFQVIDGFIEQVDVSALPKNVQRRVEQLLRKLIGYRGITLKMIERTLLLAGDVPGLQMRTALSAGKKSGGSVLTVDGIYRPVTGQLTVDNTLTPNLGWASWGAGIQANSLLGLGELVYIMLNGDPEKRYFEKNPRNRAIAAGIIIPLGNDGLSINFEAAKTRATPDHARLALGTTSEFERYSARLRYPLIRARNLSMHIEGAFDLQEENQSVISPLNLPLFLDRLRVLRGKGDAIWFAPWGATLSGSLRGSFGIDGLGARSAADATLQVPLSRQNADANFKKMEIELGYTQPFAKYFTASLAARAQTSFNHALLASEQFSLTGSSGLSTFESGSLRGDNGFVTRGEIAAPWSTKIDSYGLTFSPYIFGAIGQARLEAPTALEEDKITATSYGLGLRLAAAQNASFRSANLTFEWGKAHRSDTQRNSDQFSIVASFQF